MPPYRTAPAQRSAMSIRRWTGTLARQRRQRQRRSLFFPAQRGQIQTSFFIEHLLLAPSEAGRAELG